MECMPIFIVLLLTIKSILSRPQITNFVASSISMLNINISWYQPTTDQYILSYRSVQNDIWTHLAPVQPDPNQWSSGEEYIFPVELTFARPNPCDSYEFKLIGYRTDLQGITTETVHQMRTVPSTIPQSLPALNPIVIANQYDIDSRTVQVDIQIDINLPADKADWIDKHVKLYPYLHIIECDSPQDLLLPMPKVQRLNVTTYRFNVAEKMLSQTLQDNKACQFLFVFEPKIDICERPITVAGSLHDNSVLVTLNCKHSSHLPCMARARERFRPSKPQSPIDCRPTDVDTNEQATVTWTFSKKYTPIVYILRYGTSTDDHHFPIIATELGRKVVPGSKTMSILPKFWSKDQNYRISICAVYEKGAESKIKWNIVDSYPLHSPIFALNDDNVLHKKNELNKDNHILQSHPKHNNWHWILIVGVLFTILNLILFTFSCCIYLRAQRMRLQLSA